MGALVSPPFLTLKDNNMKNVKVKFVKDHVSGIKKGTERELNILHAQRLFEEGYVAKFTGSKEEKEDK